MCFYWPDAHYVSQDDLKPTAILLSQSAADGLTDMLYYIWLLSLC